MKKRIISMLLVIVMVLALVPVQALAAEELKVASTKSSKYVVIGVDEITLSATDLSGVAISTGKLTFEFEPADRVTEKASTDTSCTIAGASQGEVTVKVTDADGKTGTKKLTVLLPPENLQLVKAGTKEPVSGDLKVGEPPVALGYTCSNEEAIDPAYVTSNWKVLNANPEGALTISDTGVVTAVKAGKADVRFALNGKSVTKKFTIAPADPPVLKEMTVTPAQAEMYPNRPLELKASVDGVTWKSSDPSIATVNETTGEVKSLKTGSVTITATKDDYKDATCEISIVANAYRITDASGRELGETEELKVGQKMDLKVRDKSNTELSGFTFSVDGGTGITVTSDGKLEATAKTTAPVEVKAVNGITVKQKFSVLNNTLVIKAGDVTLNAEDGYSVAAGNQVQLTAVDSVTGETVAAKWYIPADVSTSVTVNSTGLLDAKAATTGSVTLSVAATGYEKVTMPITVRAKGTFSKLKILEGEKLIVNQPCHLIALDAAGNAVAGVKWEIVSGGAELDGNVLTVASTEVASVRVKATHPDYAEKPATFNVETVTPTEVKLTVDGENFPAEKTMIVGDKLTLIPQFTPEIISFPDDVTLTCQPAGIASVEKENGKWILKAQNPGEATLTASYGDVKSTYKVVVKATTEIVLDETMPVPAEILAGDELVLKAYLRDTTSGNKINANVTWKLAKESDGDYARVEKNTLDTKSELLGKRTIELIASVDSTKYTAVPLKYTVNVVPRASAISLWVNDKKVNDKETTLNLNDAAEVAAGVTIVTTISPDEAGQDVVWNITDDLGIYEEAGRVPAHVDELTGEFVPASLTLVPTSAKRSGTITVKAVAKDGTKVFATTTIHFAKLGSGNLKNAPTALRGGASLDLKPYLVQDKDLDDKSVTWSLIETDPDNDNVVVKNGKSMKKGKVIATISKAGKLTTKPVTEPTPITVKITGSDGNFAPHTITLYPATKSIKITDESYKPVPKTMEYEKLKDDRVLRLAATVKPDEADVWDLKWSSSDENIIKTVDSENGVFQIKDAGKVRIECKTTDGSNVKGYLYLVITKNSADVKISAPAKTLTAGESMNLKAKVLTANNVKAANQSVIWSIADEFGNETKAATIFPTGRVTAGDVDQSTKVVITATSAQDSSVSSTFELTILPNTRKTLHVKADGELVSGTYTMDCGEYSILEGVWLKSNKNATEKAAVDCTFFSSNESVATVEDGELDAVGYGTATITARCTDPQTGNVFTTTFTVRVMKTVKDITISVPDNRKYLRTGENLNLTATAWADIANGVKADNQTFSWTVKEVVFDRDGKESGLKDADYAAISANGKLTVKYVDYVPRIRVQAISGENNMVGEVDFTIYPQDECRLRFFMGTQEYTDILPVDYDSEFKPTVMALMVQKDSSGNLVMVQPDVTSGLTWTSDNKNVIEVGADGKTLTVKAIGKAKLTANYYNSSNQKTYQASITAVVNRTMGSIEEITQSNILVAGKSTYMRAVPANSNATNKNVLWYVDDAPGEAVSAEDVVSINRYTGKLSAKRGITDQIKVKVIAVPVDGSTEKAVEVTIYPLTTKVEIKQGGKVINGTTVLTKLSGSTPSFSATANPSGACQTFKWTSSNKRVAEVDPETGAVTIKGVGKTVIKAAALDGSGKYAKFTLRVTK